jgi:hypothetical protein
LVQSALFHGESELLLYLGQKEAAEDDLDAEFERY